MSLAPFQMTDSRPPAARRPGPRPHRGFGAHFAKAEWVRHPAVTRNQCAALPRPVLTGPVPGASRARQTSPR